MIEENERSLNQFVDGKNSTGKKCHPQQSILIEASRMAKKGGYGFLGTSGMKSYKERVEIAIEHLRNNTYRHIKARGDW